MVNGEWWMVNGEWWMVSWVSQNKDNKPFPFPSRRCLAPLSTEVSNVKTSRKVWLEIGDFVLGRPQSRHHVTVQNYPSHVCPWDKIKFRKFMLCRIALSLCLSQREGQDAPQRIQCYLVQVCGCTWSVGTQGTGSRKERGTSRESMSLTTEALRLFVDVHASMHVPYHTTKSYRVVPRSYIGSGAWTKGQARP